MSRQHRYRVVTAIGENKALIVPHWYRAKGEEIVQSTHLSRNMGENRKERNTYLSIQFPGRGGEKVEILRIFLHHNPKQNV